MQVSVQSSNELGRLLAGAQGYRVFTHEGVVLGALERVRYETQASHPDDIVVCGGGLFRRRRCTFPLGKVLLEALSRRVFPSDGGSGVIPEHCPRSARDTPRSARLAVLSLTLD